MIRDNISVCWVLDVLAICAVLRTRSHAVERLGCAARGLMVIKDLMNMTKAEPNIDMSRTYMKIQAHMDHKNSLALHNLPETWQIDGVAWVSCFV